MGTPGEGNSIDTGRFIETITRYMSNPRRLLGKRSQLVGIGTDINGAVIVIYREHTDGPLLGRRYALEEYSTSFDPRLEAAGLAMIALTDDILDPSGHGKSLDVDWADGLVNDPSEIEWHGIDVV